MDLDSLPSHSRYTYIGRTGCCWRFPSFLLSRYNMKNNVDMEMVLRPAEQSDNVGPAEQKQLDVQPEQVGAMENQSKTRSNLQMFAILTALFVRQTEIVFCVDNRHTNLPISSPSS